MPTRTFDEMNAEAMAFYAKQDYAATLDLLDREGDQYPEMAHMVYYLRSCMAARLGKNDLAAGLIQEALDNGIFYGEHTIRETPSWQPLQGRPEFERVAAQCRARELEAHAEALLMVEGPEGDCPQDRPCPAILALHGNGSDGASALNGWRPALAQGWLLAAVQSSQIMATKIYMWDDQDTALRDVADRYAELRNTHNIDPDRVVLAGFSLGGETALRAALSGTVPVRGFLLLGPGGPTIDTPEEWLPLIMQARAHQLRGYVLLGEQDLGTPHETIRAIVDLLNTHGIPTRLEILPNLAHDYPRDPAPVLERALAFIGSR